jgi:hypothetical protein
MLASTQPPPLLVDELARTVYAVVPCPDVLTKFELCVQVTVELEGKFNNVNVLPEKQTGEVPEIFGGLAGLVKVIAMGNEETADCRLQPFALTVRVPAFNPFGLNVIEVVVLVPVQPNGGVHV